jgi:hypothetical protein
MHCLELGGPFWDGFQTLSNGGYPRWRIGPSRNSIDVVSRLARSQSVMASTEPRSSITSTPKGYRDDALSGNFVTARSSRPPNSTQAGCRSRESLRPGRDDPAFSDVFNTQVA